MAAPLGGLPREENHDEKTIITAVLATIPMASTAWAGTAAPEGAELYIVAPADGAVITAPFTVRFGLKGAGVAPAGVEKAGTGHHHLLIDTPVPNLSEPIPSDDNHRHFGGGQTEAEINLAPGQHTLQLLLGDHNHIPHTPPLISRKITVTVK